jgi:imidazolonepropionase-like amidohydrolase
LPGLIDAHTHQVEDARDYSLSWALQHTGAAMALQAIPHLKATLEAGFTTVRDVGCYRAFVDVALRDAVEAGIIVGPRMQPAGAYVTMTGGAGASNGFAPDVSLPLELRFGVADGPDQVRARVRDIICRGAGLIKVLATGAILTMGSLPAAQELGYEEIRAAVEEAAKAGLKVACHCHGAEGAKDAIRAGVASIEHGSLLDEEALLMMKERGTFLVVDNYNTEWILQNPSPGYPAEYFRKLEEVAESQNRVFQRAHQLGVRLAFGTDAAVMPHGLNARQFATYVSLGMAPLEAIRTATCAAAELLGWDDRVGRLEPGFYADLIAVEGDPLEDVRLLEHPSAVIKGARQVL